MLTAERAMTPAFKGLLLTLFLFLLLFNQILAGQFGSAYRDSLYSDLLPDSQWFSNYNYPVELRAYPEPKAADGQPYDLDVIEDTPFTGSYINLEGQKITGIIIDDFLVNDDMIGGSQHENPEIACYQSGDFIITWADMRSTKWDIYAQRFYASGELFGINFKVNDDQGTAECRYPAVATGKPGSFLLTWADLRNGNWDIYAQAYGVSTPWLGNFRVNYDDTSTATQTDPSIAGDDLGSFVIAWTDSRGGSENIYAQRFDTHCFPDGSNFKVTDSQSLNPENPAIAMNNSGMFVIAWSDKRNLSYPDVYAQIYNSAGVPLGSNIKVNNDKVLVGQVTPSVGISGSGDFIITWQDARTVNLDIYGQVYSSQGVRLGSNFRVNDDTGTAVQTFPSVAMEVDGGFTIAWQDYRDGNTNIYAQRYSSYYAPLDSNFLVNDDNGTGSQELPVIAVDTSGNYVAAWRDARNGTNYNVYVQRYDSAGIPSGSNFIANDVGFSDQTAPSISMNTDGNVVITWQDLRNGNWDVYAQRYSVTGFTVDSNFRVNDDLGLASQTAPSVAVSACADFVISWTDWRNGTSDIYAQRYDSSGVSFDSNFKVASGSRGDYYLSRNDNSAVAIKGCGSFVITYEGWWYEWLGNPSACHAIYAQRHDSTGICKGFWVYGSEWEYAKAPDIIMNTSGNILITWFGGDFTSVFQPSNVVSQIYDSAGVRIGSQFKVNDDAGNSEHPWPAIASDNSGNFVITWQDYRNGSKIYGKWFYADIYAQRYDSSGTPLGSNFKVNDDTGTAEQLYPDIASDPSGNFVIVWVDYRNVNPDVYAQKYDSYGNPIGKNYIVSDPECASYKQLAPAVAANDSEIWFVWQDNRRGRGWDIYAKAVDWDWTEAEDEKEEKKDMPSTFVLLQNYPNPFNLSTIIPLSVNSKTPVHTKLKIYNVRGQLVRTLVDEEKTAGRYNVLWDGRDSKGQNVASGVYFYQIKVSDFSESKKMLLLK